MERGLEKHYPPKKHKRLKRMTWGVRRNTLRYRGRAARGGILTYHVRIARIARRKDRKRRLRMQKKVKRNLVVPSERVSNRGRSVGGHWRLRRVKVLGVAERRGKRQKCGLRTHFAAKKIFEARETKY